MVGRVVVAVVVVTEVVVVVTVVVAVVVAVVRVAAVGVRLPHAVAPTISTVRTMAPTWREAGRGVPLQRRAMVSKMLFMEQTIDLRGAAAHRTHPLRSR